ncbi:MAG: ATP-binding protein [Ardenticatenaceae bacterium]
MKPADVIQLDLPATYKYLNVLDTFTTVLEGAEGLQDPTAMAYNVQLAVHEICTNIVGHAYSDDSLGRIKITLILSQDPRALTIDLHDTGRAVDLREIAEPDLVNAQVRGYGLFLVRQLMDEVSYHSQEGKAWRSVSGGGWESYNNINDYPPPGHNQWRLIKYF